MEIPRGGDVARHSEPLVAPKGGDPGARYDVAAEQRSGYFAMSNAGKESIALDLKVSGSVAFSFQRAEAP